MSKFAITAAVALLTTPVFADGHVATGDAAAGEQQFNRQCVACHVVRDENDEVVAGRNARTGPNLYGIAGRTLGAIEGFRYGEAIVALGEDGTIWTEDAFVTYVQDPTAWLRETAGDDRARSKMAFRVRDEQQALDMYAFLATFGPEVAEGVESE